MLTYLRWHGLCPPQELGEILPEEAGIPDDNRPFPALAERDLAECADQVFHLGARLLGDRALLGLLQVWVDEERCRFLLDVVTNPEVSLERVSSALSRFRAQGADEERMSQPVRTALRVGLLHRFFSDQVDFVRRASPVVRVTDFYGLAERIVDPGHRHGKLGGKTAGLFVAWSAVQAAVQDEPKLAAVRIPRTWHLPSDALLSFLENNDLGTLHTLKYQDPEAILQDYPNLVETFRSCRMPEALHRGLAVALDDLGTGPLIVRSSSLLEDRAGSSFAGKYRSLFLANQGTREERLRALEQAVAEVYASVFSPDPIGYRAERGLLDYHEEMGLMIQQVVGSQVGRYFLPSFSGVAFSRNELRWSPRIRREDGLLRLVPGLGTRAVDRLADDYPVLLAPGQPFLRVNSTPDEVVRYSPRSVDVIDLPANRFCTLPLDDFLAECGEALPMVQRMVSRVEDDMIRKPSPLELDFRDGRFAVTFEGLVADTEIVHTLGVMLQVLEERLGHPVDLEFACDGEHLYLLQCRSQSHLEEASPDPIPPDLPHQSVLFSARRYVSNGRVPPLTHVVYVDPEAYSALDPGSMREVGRAVGRLNRLLPRRRFLLMGPGRWGSRGDIRLGVPVGYSDLNNTALLVEIARQQGDFKPDLSFGTHFFQDLVEEGIRYLPLYPDDEGVAFQELFFRRSENLLPDLLPGFAHLGHVLRVIDVPRQAEGRVLRVLMNADRDEAVGVLAEPGDGPSVPIRVPERSAAEADHWRWRMRMAERIAAEMDMEGLGVRAVYLIGSTRNGTAGPGSDVDLVLSFAGDDAQRKALTGWLDGWSKALAEMNFLRTGLPSAGLLDVHLLTDEDVAAGGGFASKIGAITDPALLLRGGDAG